MDTFTDDKGHNMTELNHELIRSIETQGNSDYEIYLQTKQLLSLQTSYEQLCNPDELQFQIVHQSEELLFKLLNHTLLEIHKNLLEQNVNKILSLFQRAHLAQSNILSIIELLHTMSPKAYQEIRLKLGNGSGQDSPGFNIFLKIAPILWKTFKKIYLENSDEKIEKIYNSNFNHCDTYLIAEAFLELDDKYNKFLYFHIKLIGRSIGLNAYSLKGNIVSALNNRISRSLFPELLEIRSQMTALWGNTYGVKRNSITPEQKVDAVL